MMEIRMVGWVMILIERRNFVVGICTYLCAIPGMFSLLAGLPLSGTHADTGFVW